jgi:hypothetical protein
MVAYHRPEMSNRDAWSMGEGPLPNHSPDGGYGSRRHRLRSRRWQTRCRAAATRKDTEATAKEMRSRLAVRPDWSKPRRGG